MKKSLIALAALAAVSAASAQSSVSIYGNLDQGYFSASSAGVNSSGMNSNIASTSTLGFKGTEDLGSGLSANFNLLGEISMKEGQMGSTTTGNATTNGQKFNMFNRGATIGLASKAYGSFDVGRITDSAWTTQGSFNNSGMNSFGYSAVNATTSNPGAVSGFTGVANPADTTFSGTGTGTKNGSNSGSAPFNFGSGFSYTSPVIAGFKGSVQSFGAETSNATAASGAGKGMAYSLNYSNPMGIRLGFGHTDRNGNTGATAISLNNFGAEYKTGKFTFVAGTTKTTYEGTWAAQDSMTTTGLGVGYDLSPQVELKAAYSTLKSDKSANKSTITGLTARYKLSKRTSLYGGMGFGSNTGTGNKQSVYYAGAVNTTDGASMKGYLVGIKHAF